MKKKKIGDNIVPQTLLPVMQDVEFLVQPKKAVNQRTILRNDQHISQLLIKWKNLPSVDSTWKDSDFITSQFPIFFHSWVEKW